MNTKPISYKPLSESELKNFKAEPGKLVNHFRTLSEKEEYIISSSILDFLYFLNSNLDMFKYYIAMLYKKFTKDTVYRYYQEHVVKSPDIEKLLNGNFEVTVDVREYINYYMDDRKNEFGDSLNHIFAIQKAIFADKDEKIKHYFQQYDFVPEVQAIIKYCRYHYYRS